MAAELPPEKTLDSLKKQAKQWLKALRAGHADARERFNRAHTHASAAPGLRDVQHALARELGFASWARLKVALEQPRATPDEAGSPLTTLLKAADRGDLDGLRHVLDAHPESIDERGELPGHTGRRTALHFGIKHAAVVRLLLERGANPNIRDDGDDAMPLHFAAESQDLEVIRLLIEHGADPIGEGTMHELDVLGWATAWDYQDARPDVVAYLLAHGARYSMPSAVALGATDSIRELARRSPAELNRPMDATNHRRRPLHLAVVKKQAGSLATLLQLGADPGQRDRAGLTPLDQAALAGETALAQRLIDHGAEIDVPAAVALGRTADIERLLAKEPGCLAPGRRWGTLIVRAAERAPVHVLETLLRLGASPNAVDEPSTAVDKTVGLTPLHAAAFKGNVEAVRVLLAHGANPRLREQKYKGTAVGWAAFAGHEAARDLLLDAPIDIFDAIAHDRRNRVEQILESDPGALDRTLGETANLTGEESWCTPLAWAAGHNKPELVRLLLSRGATVAEAPDGETLLEAAIENGFDEVAALLREHPSSGAPEASIWREAERALLAGDIAMLERLLQRHDALFRSGRPPASTPGGLAPDYSPMEARDIVVRNHQFESWDAFAAFAADANNSASLAGRFEEAADAIVKGDIPALEWLLRGRPELIHARSMRRHHAMLIHYAGPNGIEYFRQTTPANAPAIVRSLIAAGADVNATADVYGGGATVLGLAATSITPAVAGVVAPLLQALLDGGAAIEPDGGALVNGCLRNGRDEAAAFLVSRGAEVDLEAAAGIGRLDFVTACFDEDGHLKPPSTAGQMKDGFAWACEFGHADVVRFLLERGMDVRARLKHHGQTGLHWAAGGGHVETAKVLLDYGAPIDATDEEWSATPVQWALYGWQNHRTSEAAPQTAKHVEAEPSVASLVGSVCFAPPSAGRAGLTGGNPTHLSATLAVKPAGAVERYYAVVRLLVAMGASVRTEWINDEFVRADPAMGKALRGS
jgi:ankyrin repeat protein